ncbi:MAG TPA: very short patch repair endonuclease [Gammaproteobacteria bacterium]|nr:very short patch repair endonuclease [Gammaproteobacteria bacterium]
MADNLTKRQRSYCMSNIRGRDTNLELNFRKKLRQFGLRYRTKSKLIGKPDFVFSQYQTVIFLDSCFWHGCPYHFQMPATNRAFWKEKIRRNKARDRTVTRTLRNHGWRVIRLWEHAIRNNEKYVYQEIYNKILKNS